MGMWKCRTPPNPAAPPPPLLPLFLANHLATLLYLGHSNVLLLPPLADALCHNLPPPLKKRRKKETGRRGRARKWSWKKPGTFSPTTAEAALRIFLMPFSSLISPPLWAVGSSLRSAPRLPFLSFLSWFVLYSNHQWNLLKNHSHLSVSERQLMFRGTPEPLVLFLVFLGGFFWSFVVLPLLIIIGSSIGKANERERGGEIEEQVQKRQMQDM